MIFSKLRDRDRKFGTGTKAGLGLGIGLGGIVAALVERMTGNHFQAKLTQI